MHLYRLHVARIHDKGNPNYPNSVSFSRVELKKASFDCCKAPENVSVCPWLQPFETNPASSQFAVRPSSRASRHVQVFEDMLQGVRVPGLVAGRRRPSVEMHVCMSMLRHPPLPFSDATYQRVQDPPRLCWSPCSPMVCNADAGIALLAAGALSLANISINVPGQNLDGMEVAHS